MTKVNSTPIILNGHDVADEVLKNIKNELSKLITENKRQPGLAVVLVGDNLASHTYVNNKEKACTNLGIYSEVHKLPANTPEIEVIKVIERLNNNKAIDGILIQLPLPAHLNANKIIEYLDPKKDVDGIHPYNLGKLLSGQNCITPCTPNGVIKILKHYSIKINGLHVVIIGRSTLVGKPLSLLFLRENATVSIVHSKTPNIEEITRRADILICAAGKAKLVTKNWIKEGAVIIDVGINKILEAGKSKIIGDVNFEAVKNHCKAITPVPGGVGPVTIAMLMANTIEIYKGLTSV